MCLNIVLIGSKSSPKETILNLCSCIWIYSLLKDMCYGLLSGQYFRKTSVSVCVHVLMDVCVFRGKASGVFCHTLFPHLHFWCRILNSSPCPARLAGQDPQRLYCLYVFNFRVVGTCHNAHSYSC